MGYNSSFSCQHGLTNGACNHWNTLNYGNAAFSPSERISLRSRWSEGERSDEFPFHKMTNKRPLIWGCVNNYRAPRSHNSSRLSHTLVFPLHLQVLFFSSSSSGSLALSAAAPPVNYHISNFPPAQIWPLLPAWPSCLLWGGLSSSSLTVNR